MNEIENFAKNDHNWNFSKILLKSKLLENLTKFEIFDFFFENTKIEIFENLTNIEIFRKFDQNRIFFLKINQNRNFRKYEQNQNLSKIFAKIEIFSKFW